MASAITDHRDTSRLCIQHFLLELKGQLFWEFLTIVTTADIKNLPQAMVSMAKLFEASSDMNSLGEKLGSRMYLTLAT